MLTASLNSKRIKSPILLKKNSKEKKKKRQNHEILVTFVIDQFLLKMSEF